MNERRFLNRSQPQTLYMAVILCYIDVVFNLLGGLPGLILIGFVLAAGAYGIANEKKWGYSLAVGRVDRAGRCCCSRTSASSTLTDARPR